MNAPHAETRGIHVEVTSRYAPERSAPGRWFFLYSVRISNHSNETARLLSRHWIIQDAAGRVQEVKGEGVVGEQPVLEPGASHEYTSGCPLPTPFGTMRGSYQMITAAGDRFDAEIPEFVLREPGSIH